MTYVGFIKKLRTQIPRGFACIISTVKKKTMVKKKERVNKS
jgi:hypothetical protein